MVVAIGRKISVLWGVIRGLRKYNDNQRCIEDIANNLFDAYDIDIDHGNRTVSFARSKSFYISWDFDPYLYVGRGYIRLGEGYIEYTLSASGLFPIFPILVTGVTYLLLVDVIWISILSGTGLYIVHALAVEYIFMRRVLRRSSLRQ